MPASKFTIHDLSLIFSENISNSDFTTGIPFLQLFWYHAKMQDDNGLPGHLQPIYKTGKWLDYLFASNLSPEHKLAGTVISRTCQYSRFKQLQLSLVSIYTITRIVKLSKKEVQSIVDDLIRLGWLFDTGKNVGARKIYALTFSLLPLGDM